MIELLNYFLGLSGSAAVILGAYGAHRQFPESKSGRDLKVVFETGKSFI